MQVVIPDERLPVTLKLDPEARMSDDEFYQLCVTNPDVWFERTPEGEIVIVPPAGFESNDRNAELLMQLRQWARRSRRGKAIGPDALYLLPSGAAYSPDASWVSNERIAKLTKQQRRIFPRVVPEFVAEVLSPSDRLNAAKAKMKNWMANGVDLGWLIDGDRKTVYIYRAGQQEPEQRTGIGKLAGEGPVKGFVLDLEEIWEGL